MLVRKIYVCIFIFVFAFGVSRAADGRGFVKRFCSLNNKIMYNVGLRFYKI